MALTKVDQICGETSEGIKKVFKSERVGRAVKIVSERLSLDVKYIRPVQVVFQCTVASFAAMHVSPLIICTS